MFNKRCTSSILYKLINPNRSNLILEIWKLLISTLQVYAQTIGEL